MRLLPIPNKKAVELHGGTIAIDSKVDAGTRISIHLPLTPAPKAKAN